MKMISTSCYDVFLKYLYWLRKAEGVEQTKEGKAGGGGVDVKEPAKKALP